MPKGFRAVHPEAVTKNGLLFRDLPIVDKCVVIMPDGKAAMSEWNLPYVYASIKDAAEDIPHMGSGDAARKGLKNERDQ
jgi:hypothetical protein